MSPHTPPTDLHVPISPHNISYNLACLFTERLFRYLLPPICNNYWNVLCIAFYAIYSIHHTIVIVSYAFFYAVYSMYYILWMIFLCIVHCILSIVFYQFYYMDFILCNSLYALYSMNCIIHIVFY